MKKGTGSDPFADAVEDEEEVSEPDEPTETEVADTETADDEERTTESAPETESNESDSTTDEERGAEDSSSDTTSSSDSGMDSSDEIVSDPPQAGANDDGIPWVYVRDNVKQDRGMVQFYLRDYLVDAEDDFVDAVSEELGTDVSKTDVREAAYEAAMYNVDEVVDRLRAWGFESEN